MKRLNGGCAFSNGCSDSFHRAAAHVAHRKNTRSARFEEMPGAFGRPLVSDIGTGQHEAVSIEFDAIAKPAGIRLRAEKQEHMADRLLFDSPLLIPLNRLEMRFTV